MGLICLPSAFLLVKGLLVSVDWITRSHIFWIIQTYGEFTKRNRSIPFSWQSNIPCPPPGVCWPQAASPARAGAARMTVVGSTRIPAAWDSASSQCRGLLEWLHPSTEHLGQWGDQDVYGTSGREHMKREIIIVLVSSSVWRETHLMRIYSSCFTTELSSRYPQGLWDERQ